MALSIDATASSTTHSATDVTTLDNANLTVGGSASGLLAVVMFQEASTVPTSVTMRWDPTGTNQAMTQVVNRSSGNSNGEIYIYGLVSPTPGNKILRAAWTTAVPAMLTGISFSGGITTSVATAFVRGGSNAALSGSPTVTLTGASGNISVCVYDDVINQSTSLTTTGSTNWFIDNAVPIASFRGATAPSASSVVWTGAPTSTEWVIAGIDVVAGSGISWAGGATEPGAGGVAASVVARLVGTTLIW